MTLIVAIIAGGFGLWLLLQVAFFLLDALDDYTSRITPQGARERARAPCRPSSAPLQLARETFDPGGDRRRAKRGVKSVAALVGRTDDKGDL